jgi:uncharacterized protein
MTLFAPVLFAAILQVPTPPQQSAPDVVAKSQTILARVAAGEFGSVEERFTDKMKAAWPPGRLAELWKSLVNQVGAHKGCESKPRVVAIADKQMVITACDFERAKIDIQLAFDSAGRISGMAMRPAAGATVEYSLPPYANPSSFTEAAMTVGSGEWALPATLTLPVGTAPVPAVILVHGSGPADRDETVGANKPFKDLAVGLASRGIAVLRYDKRTRVHAAKLAGATDLATDFTVKQEAVDDVLEALKALRADRRIDAARVFVLGHSLGGMLVPRIAAADPSISGFIVLAGAARPLEEAIAAQVRYMAVADGTISPDEQKRIDEATAIGDSVRALKPADASSGRMIFGAPASYWLDLRGYDPPSAAKQVKGRMLILQGERDYQVTVEEFGRWKTALGSRSDVTFRSYPALNHLFIAGTGPSLPAEYLAAGHVAEEVIRDIATWVFTAPR